MITLYLLTIPIILGLAILGIIGIIRENKSK
jgi:hypothetical protein